MRKMFRFKYEACAGKCYAWCDTLPRELNAMTDADRKATIDSIVEAHSRLCDNPDYSFGVDMEDVPRAFVSHYRHPEGTELFYGATFGECVMKVCRRVLGAAIPKPAGGACVYGDNGAEDLGREILKACTDEGFRKAHHDSCPCREEVRAP